MKKVINIFGDITSEPALISDVSALKIHDEINGLTAADELEINVNSYGGEVFEAVAIANLLASSPAKKTFNILGLCASSATMLFSPNDTVFAANGIMTMYHKPQAAVSSDASGFRSLADRLDQIENENIIKNLSIRTGKKSEELSELIKNEWWLTSDESIQILGFLPLQKEAIINRAQTKQIGIFKNYIERKKALSSNAFNIYINHKNSLK